MWIPVVLAIPISRLAASYIARQHDHFWSLSLQLSETQRTKLRPFFPIEVLETVRIAKGAIPSPLLYRFLRKFAPGNLPNLSTIAGITFQDVIVHSERISDPLLFHELVHVVQCQVLGLKRFTTQYVRGFLSTRKYEDIPLE